jgi:hypothetical protein
MRQRNVRKYILDVITGGVEVAPSPRFRGEGRGGGGFRSEKRLRQPLTRSLHSRPLPANGERWSLGQAGHLDRQLAQNL